MMNEENLKKYAPIVLRLGMSIVFFWFGLSQLKSQSNWIGVLPDWTASLPISQATFVMLNGGMEVFLGILLVVGLGTRWVALILSLHLFSIAITIGLNPTGVRDFGLAIATAVVALYGVDKWSLEYFMKPKEVVP